MEFVETPSFWCPHVDRAACTNFSTQTVELRLSERQEILHFSFFPSFSPFLPTNSFLFLISFFSFLFAFLFFFSTNSFSPFLFGLFSYPPIEIAIDRMSKEETSSPFPFCHMPFPCISFLFLYLFYSFIASSPMWLIVSHTFKCTTWLLPCVTPLGGHVASPKSHHMSSDTLRLEKHEIPTLSESNDIRRS